MNPPITKPAKKETIMATKKTSRSKAKPSRVQVRDLKPTKNPKGGLKYEDIKLYNK